jgi:uncharacterized membrane protein HdeD (DUF308 family)
MEAVREPLKAWIQKARKNAGRMILAGILSVIAGILCIAHPALGSLSVTFIVGIMMIVGGIARMFGVFSADSFGHGLLALLGGVLTLIAGLITVAMPGLVSPHSRSCSPSGSWSTASPARCFHSGSGRVMVGAGFS